jgi:23S rRNA (adenine1618-N6)-methyltransferase
MIPVIRRRAVSVNRRLDSPAPPAPTRHLKTAPNRSSHTRGELHPRNPHRAPYDFLRLIEGCPELKPFLRPHLLGGETVDFSDPAAVKALNRALLHLHYGVAHWDIPPGYLCPPIPSRADYLHYAADLLAEGVAANLPRGPAVTVLDLGVGANCVYPLIGVHAYGWNFIGTDVDRVAVDWASQLVAENPALAGKIICRHQPDPSAILSGMTRPGELFALSICNPPFHASLAEATAGTRRKLKNLGGGPAPKTTLNFGGQSHELWCPGGEAAFVRRLIRESAAQPKLCVWFTSLVSKRDNLPVLYSDLAKARVADIRTLTMFAGQKQSRVLAWTFLPASERRQRLSAGAAARPGQ